MINRHKNSELSLSKDKEQEGGGEEFSSLSESESSEIDRIIENAFLEVFGRPINRPSVGSYSSSSDYDFAEALVRENLVRHVDEKVADPIVLTLWDRFYQNPRTVQEDIFSTPQITANRPLPKILDSVFDPAVLKVVPTLGADVAAVSFMGPNRSMLIVSKESLSRADGLIDNLEAEFRIWHHYAHVLSGDLRIENYGCRFEYKNNSVQKFVQETLKNPDYSATEASANDTAVRFMYDAYSNPSQYFEEQGLLLSTYSSKLTGTKIGGFARSLAGHSNLGSETPAAVGRWAIRRMLSGIVRPQPYFKIPISLARANWWSPVYLLWTTNAGERRRRWIPSRTVVHALGLRLNDIPKLDMSAIEEFEYDGILVEPSAVKHLRYLLEKYVSRTYLPHTPKLDPPKRSEAQRRASTKGEDGEDCMVDGVLAKSKRSNFLKL